MSSPTPPSSPPPTYPEPPGAHWKTDAARHTLYLQGNWQHAPCPDLPAPPSHGTLAVDGHGVTAWNSQLAASLWELQTTLRHDPEPRPLDLNELPAGLRNVLALLGTAPAAPTQAPAPSWLARLGLRMRLAQDRFWQSASFVGETLIALGRAARGRTAMRGMDLLLQLHRCGPASLGIVTLVSFLVGLILAYLGAAQLQRFGAQIYMADLVTIGMVREIAALMTAIVLAGRVGAAFAAQLGSMEANEEVDALRSLGLHPVEHLVLPRVLALTLMTPLLAIYAALVGMVAGLLVAVGIFHVEPLEYLIRSFHALTLTHVGIGLFKATVYGMLIAIAGCRQGLHSGRSAQAVGDATTAAVVQAIVWIVAAASLLTVSFQRLGW